MPLHDYRCKRCGTIEERFTTIEALNKVQEHNCTDNHGVFTAQMERIFLRAPMGFVQADVCYDSPIDGRPITNRFARLNDLRRNECVEYDPGMKQDAARRKKAEESALDAAVDRTVEEFIATAPTRKVEKLAEELNAGATLEVTRASPETAGTV